MYYKGDVIERLDRIEYLLAEVNGRLATVQQPLNPSLGGDGRLLIRVSDAAKQLGLSRGSLYQLIAAGKFPSVRIGRAVRIPLELMIEWMRKLESQR
jgi:excisionase family DNA binding protein